MPLVDVAELAPIRRLLQVAASDTGQSRRVADFLLAWWNAGSCDGFDLAELSTMDEAIAADMLATVAFIAARREYPNALPGSGLRAAAGAVAATACEARHTTTVRVGTGADASPSNYLVPAPNLAALRQAC